MAVVEGTSFLNFMWFFFRNVKILRSALMLLLQYLDQCHGRSAFFGNSSTCIFPATR